jgi:ATP-dependent RNA helicase SUPV3L1/SUV3
VIGNFAFIQMSARLAPLRLFSSGAPTALNSLRIWEEVTCARRLFHASPSISRSSKDYKKYLKAKEKARDSLWTPLNGYSSANKGRYPTNVIPNPRKKRRLDNGNILRDLRSGLFDWCRSTKVQQTIISLGVENDAALFLLQSFEVAARAELTDRDHATTKDRWHLPNLESAFDTDYERALHKAYLNRLLDYAVSNNEHSSAQLNPLAQVRKITDMRFPAEWYPKARSVKRKIIMHVGPTNSGKTYNALRALAAARSGVYAGPLRLLAHEVWERLNNGSISVPRKDTGLDLLDNANLPPPRENPLEESSRGRACNLLTGEEQRVVDPEAGLVSCTIEMLPIHTFYDVAVIDEIQMLGDPERGLSWTHALLSVCASEVHLCGEATVVDLVRRIASETGDEFVVNEYQRLTPLVVSPSLDGDLSLVTKGDCVVSFSRSKIFDLKQSIERQTGLKCAVAYGRLPPEVRSEQAQYFNDPESGFDVMVASDAVGMGLNLCAFPPFSNIIFTMY